MPIERRPKSPVPRGRVIADATPHVVTDGESFLTLQERYGVEAKKIIYANFNTLVPAEINWYLRSYVGCVKPTRDGKNWMFSKNIKPGVIQIPPKEIVFTDPVEVVGTLPPLYFTVTVSPTSWEAPPGMADNGATAKQIVTLSVWQHTRFSVGSVSVTGRAGWGASDPVWANEVIYYNLFRTPLKQLLTRIVVHHTNNDSPVSAVESKQKSKGYAALGYHFFVAKNGSVFEGRPLEVMGSHAGTGKTSGPTNDPDWGSIGIVMQGDYHSADNWVYDSEIPAVQLTALENLIVGLRGTYPIQELLMHRDVERGGTPTVCPGDQMVPHVQALRTKLGFPTP